MSDWEHHESEQEWERRQFQEWEEKEFEEYNKQDVEATQEVYSNAQPTSTEQLEFAIRELSTTLRNLIEVVDRNEDTYNMIVPSTLHAALLTVMDEIARWDYSA